MCELQVNLGGNKHPATSTPDSEPASAATRPKSWDDRGQGDVSATSLHIPPPRERSATATAAAGHYKPRVDRKPIKAADGSLTH